MTDNYSTLRLYPCYLLQENKIPCIVWFEDALRHYNVPTIVFNLHILVKDIDTAAQVLIQKGWTLVAQDPTEFDIGIINKAHRRLVPPKICAKETQGIGPRTTPTPTPPPPPPPPAPSTKPAGLETTILLPAAEWNYKLPQHIRDTSDGTAFYPSLPAFVDALIDSFLDSCSDESRLWSRLAFQMGYLYQYTPALKNQSFARAVEVRASTISYRFIVRNVHLYCTICTSPTCYPRGIEARELPTSGMLCYSRQRGSVSVGSGSVTVGVNTRAGMATQMGSRILVDERYKLLIGDGSEGSAKRMQYQR